MSTDQDRRANRAIAIDFVRALFIGDVETFRTLLHPEFVSVIVGDLALAGTRDVKEFLALLKEMRATEFASGPFTFTLGAVTAEDDRVCIEAESRIALRNGKLYNNLYVFTVVIRDQKVVLFKEFGDSRHAARVLESDRFTAVPRERTNLLYDTPSHVFEGTM